MISFPSYSNISLFTIQEKCISINSSPLKFEFILTKVCGLSNNSSNLDSSFCLSFAWSFPIFPYLTYEKVNSNNFFFQSYTSVSENPSKGFHIFVSSCQFYLYRGFMMLLGPVRTPWMDPGSTHRSTN